VSHITKNSSLKSAVRIYGINCYNVMGSLCIKFEFL